MHITPRVFLLRVVHGVMLIADDQAIAAGRVRVERTAGLHREVGRLLHRLDRQVPCRLAHDTALAADPSDDSGSILIVMAPPRLAFLAATPRLAAQRFRPARLGLSLVSGGVVEVIGFDRPFQLTTDLIGQGRIA